MSDCVSLPNAEELVEQMRLCADDKSVHCKECKFVDTVNNMCMNIMVNCAADAIERLVTRCNQLTDDVSFWRKLYEMTDGEKDYWEEATSKLNARDKLLAENAKLEAERDAAVADLKEAADCTFCKFDCGDGQGCNCLATCRMGELFEWRGVKEEAKEKAMDDDPDIIMVDEYLDDERNGEEDAAD